MKILKYLGFSSEQRIKRLCKKYDIVNYTINYDNTIDVSGSVNLSNNKFKNKITGYEFVQ